MKIPFLLPTYKKTIEYTTYGILDTPMYPCQWYSGPIRQDRDGSWYAADNSTHNFYRTLAEAVKAFKNFDVYGK